MLLAGWEREEDCSTTARSIMKPKPAVESEAPPPLERVPPLPVLCFLVFYLMLGKYLLSLQP